MCQFPLLSHAASESQTAVVTRAGAGPTTASLPSGWASAQSSNVAVVTVSSSRRIPTADDATFLRHII